jgi:hypothetical protein
MYCLECVVVASSVSVVLVFVSGDAFVTRARAMTRPRGRCRARVGHNGHHTLARRLVFLALTRSVSFANAQQVTSTASFTFLSPSPCVFRIDALDAKVTALETSLNDGGVTAMGARTSSFVTSDTAGGFFGAAFQGMGRETNEMVTAQGERTSSDALFGVSATGDRSAALGDGTVAQGDFSLAAGRNSYATKASSLAFGDTVVASGEASVAFGRNSKASAQNSVSFGDANEASGVASSAMGRNSQASGNAAVAMGDGATARGSGGISLGVQTRAEGTGPCAFPKSETTVCHCQYMKTDTFFYLSSQATPRSRSAVGARR